MSRFINTELESESESDLESKSDTELMAKLESGSGLLTLASQKTLMVILLTLNNLKNLTDKKTPFGETGCLSIFFLCFFFFFFECLGIQFFDSPPFLKVS